MENFLIKVPWSRRSAYMLILACYVSSVLTEPNIGGGEGTPGGEHSHLDADDQDFSGIVDFSNAIPGPDGSWCITKTKYVDHMVRDQLKECWHQNVSQCHDTYVTEFLPSQEQKCEETFWKSCKIDFKEAPYNYTMKQCHTPLVKECDPPSYNPSLQEAKIVCKTWFESECNITIVETSPAKDDIPNTWCSKVPRKICAPDNCRMVPGPEQCNQKMMVSTIEQPSEICDLQPQTHCRLITRLVPHLIQKEVCRLVPKEMCHLALANPHMVKKPMRLRWCTKTPPEGASTPQYKPSYLPPPPQSGNNGRSPPSPPVRSSTPTPTFTPTSFQLPPEIGGGPSFSSPTGRPSLQFQRRSQLEPVYETKFKPILPRKPSTAEVLKPERLSQENPKNILIEDFFVQNSAEDLELMTKVHPPQPLVHTTTTEAPQEEEEPAIDAKEDTEVSSEPMALLPKLLRPKKPSVNIPYHVSISDELSEVDSYHHMFGSNNGDESVL